MNKREGYTILEVLMALVILGIILPALIIYVTSGRKTRHNSFVAESATALAQRSLDSLAQLSRGVRVPVDSLTPVARQYQDREYFLSWRFHTPNAPYQGQVPGLVHVLVTYRSGNTDHRTALDGTLP